MGRGRSKNGNKGKGGLEEEDFRLWKAFTHDIQPLDQSPFPDDSLPSPPAPTVSESTKGPRVKTLTAPSPLSKTSMPSQAPQLDLRTDLRLRRGKMPIEGTIDLHGCTQDQAHAMLNDFILRSYKGGKRCVLVITGKGRMGEGVLKTKFPQWISMAPLRDIVLKTYAAAQKDGGGGAWYVYLKRQRPYTD